MLASIAIHLATKYVGYSITCLAHNEHVFSILEEQV
jgi:hypothetical protein